jgi:hypothetical protein
LIDLWLVIRVDDLNYANWLDFDHYTNMNIEWALIIRTGQIMHDYDCCKLTLSYSEMEGSHNLKGYEWKITLRSPIY